MVRNLFLTIALAGLSACGGGGLRDLRGDLSGPDEFSIIPSKPLVIPENLNLLPPPTPGGTNPADPNPKGDAIAALGGNPAAAFAGGIPSADAALVAHAGRNGTAPGIRATLAAEDAALRGGISAGGVLGLFGGGDRYWSLYANQSLDAQAELQRFRAAGIRTPSAPPAP